MLPPLIYPQAVPLQAVWLAIKLKLLGPYHASASSNASGLAEQKLKEQWLLPIHQSLQEQEE